MKEPGAQMESQGPQRELAIVTGASMGLGEEFCRQLAARGVDLLLAARSRERMQAVADSLITEFKIEARVVECDLSEFDAPQRIVAALDEWQRTPTWLINNAGFGIAGAFERLTPETVRDICNVNVTSLTQLTSLLLPRLQEATKGTARILNVASVAGFQPVPYFGVYSASKAYVISFSEAIYEELKGQSIRVTCVCPGYTETNFASNNQIKKTIFKGTQSAASVVREAIAASDAGEALIIHRNKAQIFSVRLMPRTLVRKVAALVAKSYRD